MRRGPRQRLPDYMSAPVAAARPSTSGHQQALGKLDARIDAALRHKWRTLARAKAPKPYSPLASEIAPIPLKKSAIVAQPPGGGFGRLFQRYPPLPDIEHRPETGLSLSFVAIGVARTAWLWWGSDQIAQSKPLNLVKCLVQRVQVQDPERRVYRCIATPDRAGHSAGSSYANSQPLCRQAYSLPEACRYRPLHRINLRLDGHHPSIDESALMR